MCFSLSLKYRVFVIFSHPFVTLNTFADLVRLSDVSISLYKVTVWFLTKFSLPLVLILQLEATKLTDDLEHLEASANGLVVLLMPPRQVESCCQGQQALATSHYQLSSSYYHRYVEDLNEEVNTSISNAINNVQPLNSGFKLTTLSSFEPKKCPIVEGVDYPHYPSRSLEG